MNQAYIQIDNLSLFVSILFMGITIFLSYIEKLKLEKDLIVGTLRCFAQLMAVGYFLKVIFDANKWYWVALTLLVMLLVAAYEAVRRQEKKSAAFFLIVMASLSFSTLLIMGVTLYFILKVEPWYNPQYIIPMMGMLVGNSTTGAALLINRLRSEIRDNREKIEAKLSLGASAKEAVHKHLQSSIQSSMIPSINSLMVVGIVSLPGMMTGQIIAGADPVDSVRYQVIIMYIITASVSISIFLSALLSYKQFFTNDLQIRDEML